MDTKWDFLRYSENLYLEFVGRFINGNFVKK